MAQAAWPQVFKQVCGTPDFDTIKEELGGAHAGILEIKRQILGVAASLKAGRDAIDGLVGHVGGLGERLCALERRVDDFTGTAAGLEDSIVTVQGAVSAQGTLIQSVKQQVETATLAVAGVQTGLASAQNNIGAFEGRLCAIESRLDDLSCKTSGLDRSVGDLDAKATAQVKLSEGIQTQVNVQAASIESAESAIVTLTSRVARSERRWRWLWGYCQLLPLHLPGSPPTPCSQLLHECGVGDLRALSRQSPPDLARTLAAQNAQSKRLDEDPDEDDVAELVRHAKETQGGPAKKA
jgi:hypothetical protein